MTQVSQHLRGADVISGPSGLGEKKFFTDITGPIIQDKAPTRDNRQLKLDDSEDTTMSHGQSYAFTTFRNLIPFREASTAVSITGNNGAHEESSHHRSLSSSSSPKLRTTKSPAPRPGSSERRRMPSSPRLSMEVAEPETKDSCCGCNIL